ncbi:MAG: biopolymer transporter ExbD [Phycisphaerales bacterium]
MRMQRRRSSRFDPEKVRLPLVALIDVVLFLLFYFMIAGSSAGQESELSTALATAGNGGSGAARMQPQVLAINMSNGKVVYNIGQRTISTRTTLEGLLKALPKESGIVVKPAADVSVESIAAAVQVAKDVGFSKISYVMGK